MYLGVVGIAAQGGEFRDQIDSFEKILIHIRLIRRIIVVIERENCGLQLVHEIPGWFEQKLISQKTLGQFVAHGQTGLEVFKLLLVRQITEQQKKTGLLKTEISMPVSDQIPDGIAAVEEITIAGNYIAFFVLGIADDVGNTCQTDPDAGTVLVAQTFFYIIFSE
jgi:hypothetical protein